MNIIVEFFFFKQKTAYEMRISDWSSDVCSSDLVDYPGRQGRSAGGHMSGRRIGTACGAAAFALDQGSKALALGFPLPAAGLEVLPVLNLVLVRNDGVSFGMLGRSEEHTSELQSLMRISYAVFCLKKKKDAYNNTHA